MQYLDLGKTYVHWKQGHPQAAAQDGPDGASDASSEEGVNPGSDSGAPLRHHEDAMLRVLEPVI